MATQTNDTLLDLSQRVEILEKVVSQIIALPQMSKLAERESLKIVGRVQWATEEAKRQLAEGTLDNEQHKELEERIARYEDLVSPTLSLKLGGNGAVKVPNESEVHAD